MSISKADCPPARRQAGGFTLLETVVALAIFAAAAMSLYGLFNTNLIALNRVQEVTRHLPVARHAVEMVSTVNPWEQDSGQFAHEGFDIAWSARLLQPVRHGQNTMGLMTAYDFGLYEVEIEISEAGRPVDRWRMRLVGYENVRGIDPDVLF